MSIGLRIILSCTLPIILLGGLYFGFTIYNTGHVIDREIDNWGKIISSSLMDNSAQVLLTGQPDFLDQNALTTLSRQPEIASIEWRNPDGQIIARMDSSGAETPETGLIKTYPVYFNQLIRVDAFDNDLQLDQANQRDYEQKLVGDLIIAFDREGMMRKAYRDVLLNLSYFLLLLLTASVIAIANALYLSASIQRVFRFITDLDKGNYHQQPVKDDNHEIHELQRQLNKLAKTLKDNQQQIRYEKEALNNAISKLTDARNETDKANNWLKKMLGILSHEMRTPLNAIIGSLDMAISQSRTPFVVKRLENAISHASYMVSELENLLDYIQIDEQKFVIHYAPVNVYKLLQVITDNYRYLAEEKNLTLTLHHIGEENHENLMLMSDYQRLSQIVINLVSNAIKFSEHGEISVVSRIKPIPGSDCYSIAIEVSDQGIGIPANQLSDIFNIFQQVDFDIARRYEGLGIGLAISKKYVDLLNGKLSVRSQIGQGSVFYFSLLADPADVPAGNPQNEEPSSTARKINNVYIVEDNIVNCNVLCELLKRTAPALNLVTESDGRKASHYIATHANTFDLALIDIHLPGISGIQLIEQLRSHYPDKKIVAITADTTWQTQEACFAAGADLFIKKPIRLSDIYRILHHL